MTENTDYSLSESLSALVDGECTDTELQQILDALEAENPNLYQHAANSSSDPASSSSSVVSEGGSLRDSWKRMHLAKNSRDITDLNPTIDLSLAISEAIAKEELPQVKAVPGTWAKWRPLRDFAGKTAIAASVALAFVAGVQYLNPTSEVEPLVADKADSQPHNNMPGAVVPQWFELPPLEARTVSAGNSVNSNARARVTPSPADVLPSGAVLIRSAEMDEYINRLLYMHAEQTASSGALGLTPYARVSNLEAAEENELNEAGNQAVGE